MTITKNLQAIRKELTRLVKQTEKLAEALGKAEKKKSLKTKTKEKDITKKAPTKAAKKTYTDKVLAIIKRSKKGVNIIRTP